MTDKEKKDIPEETQEQQQPQAEETVEAVKSDNAEDEIKKLQNDLAELNDSYLRLHADFDNFRKRAVKEKTEISTYALSDLMTKLLHVLDNFDRAMASCPDDESPFYEGVKMVAKQLNDIMTEEGLCKIEAQDTAFDPNLHYAVMTECDETKDDNVITQELQTGYRFKDKVIRPSMVKVNKL
jgi:molecular chaperone GrpE